MRVASVGCFPGAWRGSLAFSSRQFALNTIKHGLFFSASHYFSFLKPILMQSDWWIEKGGFRSETKSGILTQSKKCLFDPNFFDRAIRSAHPVEQVYFFDEMCGSNCSIEKVGIEKALFRLRKNAPFGLRSEIVLCDPPIRLHKNWAYQ